MDNWFDSLVLTFVPLFIVIDALGILPFVVTLCEGRTKKETHRIVHIATITAALVGLAFLFFGQFILIVMGISVGAFAISGGLILLLLSLKYMTTGRMVDAVKEEVVAIVPIGTPLTVGPATITTLLLLVAQFPLHIVLIAFMLNILVTWLLFLFSGYIIRFMGRGGLKAVSQVFNLLLAAIAVTMVLRGLDMLGIIEVSL
jgi:multiple antibiotic resistance protein